MITDIGSFFWVLWHQTFIRCYSWYWHLTNGSFHYLQTWSLRACDLWMKTCGMNDWWMTYSHPQPPCSRLLRPRAHLLVFKSPVPIPLQPNVIHSSIILGRMAELNLARHSMQATQVSNKLGLFLGLQTNDSCRHTYNKHTAFYSIQLTASQLYWFHQHLTLSEAEKDITPLKKSIRFSNSWLTKVPPPKSSTPLPIINFRRSKSQFWYWPAARHTLHRYIIDIADQI